MLQRKETLGRKKGIVSIKKKFLLQGVAGKYVVEIENRIICLFRPNLGFKL